MEHNLTNRIPNQGKVISAAIRKQPFNFHRNNLNLEILFQKTKNYQK
jgi:hypothetical protein